MPTSLDDQARLPPMNQYDDVAEKQRLEDMKEFRKYLVETGTAKCLVKMYQHIAKNEMRLDNPKILKEFLGDHVEENEITREIDRLLEENASLRDRSSALQAQAEALEAEVAIQRRVAVGRSIWEHMLSNDFWEGQLDDDVRTVGLPLKLFYHRLCGQKVDKATGKILVNLLRPPCHDENEVATGKPVDLSSFSSWVANDISEDLYAWCCENLLPRFAEVPLPTEPPYERELLQEIRETGFYPDNLDEVPNIVMLDLELIAFLDGVATRFGS